MEQLTIHRNIPVKYTADLCIAGAGPAGIAAAVTAARRGVRVLLIDHLAMPGGMSTAALVPVFMPCSDGVNFLAAGFGSEVIDRLQKFAARRNFDSGLAINAEHLKRVYDDLLAESGVKPLYYTRLIDAVVESGRIEALLCNGPSGNFAIKAPIFIDATGDGTLSVIAGAPFEFGGENGEVMPSTLCSLWAGIDFAAYRAGGAFSHNDDKMLAKLEEAFQRGELSVPDFHHTGVFRVSNVAAVGNITHVFDVDATDEQSLTRGVIENRRLLAEYEEFYRRQVAGFAEAEIVGSGSVLGIRESRRILGDYVLNRDDYEARRDFPDEIGRYNFPADIHPPRPGKEEVIAHKKLFRSFCCGRGESYGIPYRILLPRGVENLLTCGRCVSCDRHVMASLRVIPGCYITGQGAGMAAALAAAAGTVPRKIDTAALRKELRGIGAFFH
ncbi:FAD-dependent oxidoreductase [uncultured Victivallis sp.]|uniref:FAD-dependent oxidoreductase n=1 Tax=uncultured Victivallis sp. TaxID=354118 RepID=UPI0025E97EFC|nr:FAD-dependent oxidoreductase [uncultured Victivallis sp.]